MRGRLYCRSMLKGMWKRNPGNRLFLLCVSFAAAIPILLTACVQSILYSVQSEKEEVYGSFSDIYYAPEIETAVIEQTEELMDRYMNGFPYELAGAMFEVGAAKTAGDTGQQGTELAAGYADETALELGKIHLTYGRMPKEPGEAALTETAWQQLGVSELGQEITVMGQTLAVTGQIKNYGRLWPIGEKQVKMGIGRLQIFMTRSQAQTLADQYGIQGLQILTKRREGVAEAGMADEAGDLLPNSNMMKGGSENFTIPSMFYWILTACSVLIVYNILLLSAKRRGERIAVFRELGMTGAKAFLYLLAEIGLLGVGGAALGCLLGAAGTRVLLWLFGRIAGEEITVHLTAAAMLRCAGAVFLAALAAGICSNIYLLKGKKQILYIGRQRQAKRLSLPGLAFLECRRHRHMMAALILLTALSGSLICYSGMYQRQFADVVQYTEIDGKMPLDYDFEVYTQVFNGPVVNDPIYFTSSYMLDGMDEAGLERLSAIKGITEIRAYKEAELLIMNPGNRLDEHLDGADMALDGAYHPSDRGGLTQELREEMGYEGMEEAGLIGATLFGYPKEDMEEFSAYVTEGEINPEKICSGEEVVLVVPAYRLERLELGKDENGDMLYGVSRSTVKPEDEGAINDSLFSVGDTITLSVLYSPVRINGGMNREMVQENLQRRDVTVRIGAIIRQMVGWFEWEGGPWGVYRIMTATDAFDSLEVPCSYSRIRLYAGHNAVNQEQDADIREILADYPYMALQNLQSELQSYHQLSFMAELFAVLLTILALAACAVSILGQMLSKNRLNQPLYDLLWQNGLTLPRLAGAWGIQLLLIGAGGAALALPAVLGIAYIGFQAEPQYLSIYLSGKTTALAAAGMTILLCAALAGCIRQEQRHRKG